VILANIFFRAPREIFDDTIYIVVILFNGHRRSDVFPVIAPVADRKPCNRFSKSNDE
jgi:hypothetical protein